MSEFNQNFSLGHLVLTIYVRLSHAQIIPTILLERIRSTLRPVRLAEVTGRRRNAPRPASQQREGIDDEDFRAKVILRKAVLPDWRDVFLSIKFLTNAPALSAAVGACARVFLAGSRFAPVRMRRHPLAQHVSIVWVSADASLASRNVSDFLSRTAVHTSLRTTRPLKTIHGRGGTKSTMSPRGASGQNGLIFIFIYERTCEWGRAHAAARAQVMRRACADVCLAPPAPAHPSPPADTIANNRNSPPQNKELLRQQLLAVSTRDSKEAAVSTPRPKHARSRQKNRWKLKFHHQALPQEYLDHYEQSLQRAQAARRRPEPAPAPPRRLAHASGLPPSPSSHEASGNDCVTWSQRSDDSGDVTARADGDRRRKSAVAPAASTASATRAKAVTYDDLPYMGEITLNHAKPRRGRKPKKADICHLIYENYGTVVPGQPQSDAPLRPPSAPAAGPPAAGAHAARADLQNRIISSLLERKRRRPPADDEPLNLCIRDLHDLRIRTKYKLGEAQLPAAAELEQPNAISVIQRNTNLPSPSVGSGSPDTSSPRTSPALSEPARRSPGADGDHSVAPGYVYWPSAGVYMHPLALHTQLLYYQRLAAAARTSSVGNCGDDDASRPVAPAASPDDVGTKLVLKQISELLDPSLLTRMEDAEPGGVKRSSPQSDVGTGSATATEARGPAKRKRSAIFIPPVPTRSNAATPTAEVSICKFKFTGGSKPSLQEKKMLSVDAGGNFRYYSGASGKGKSPEGPQRRPSPAESTAPAAPAAEAAPGPEAARGADDGEARRKRRSRKSLQRERLERTFKEKGFLIQTQQLQSAEGATYCKFRQLRKFTRYLFRSWKDYLPGELHERAPAAPAAAHPRPPDWT
ncbi:hypothetical protein EVAR_70015_1 [Eumeta japonica]|uniref:Uncharacterized protein n=1 Tax=Eumeta variegata TaxID=151549 RepID=A0A4C2AHC5_EUMVA|nr:hypothetical protein EVAR_70015_1 [Eumeta japonica]